MSLEKRLIAIQNSLLPFQATLVAVSKTHPCELILEAYKAGQRVFGENKVQELVHKYEQLPKDIAWHLIGHLQTNKVKYIAPFVSLIHSVDSLKLLAEINKEGQKNKRIINVLLQVHIAQEHSKFGVDKSELPVFIDQILRENFTSVCIKGLMGMATFTDDESQISAEFAQIHQLFKEIGQQISPQTHPNFDWKILSTGMSDDYMLALANGSTHVRVGSALFGNRSYQAPQ